MKWWTWGAVIEAGMPATYLVEVDEAEVPEGTPLFASAERARRALQGRNRISGEFHPMHRPDRLAHSGIDAAGALHVGSPEWPPVPE